MIKLTKATQAPVAEVMDGTAILFEPYKSASIHWSVPWSDLMMTMFILFAVLFAYHVSEQGKFPTENITAKIEKSASGSYWPDQTGPQTQSPPPAMEALLQISKQAFGPQGLEGVASVQLDKDGAVMIVLTSDVLFDSGRAELNRESVRPLQQVAQIVRDTPYILNIIGHTDNVAINNEHFSSNWELSTARACVTARYLIHEMGISPTRIYAAGHAEYDPIKLNHTPEGRAVNRRVEIIISQETPYLNSGRPYSKKLEKTGGDIIFGKRFSLEKTIEGTQVTR